MSRITRTVATALLGAGVFVVAACGGGGGATASPSASSVASPAASPSASAAASPSASAAASPSGVTINQAMVQFTELGDSTITGGAILTDLGDNQTAVTIGVVAAGITEPMPAELIAGSCADVGSGAAASPAPSAAPASPDAGGSAAPAAGAPFKLNDLTAGASNTVIESSLDPLVASSHAIVIHRSAADATAVACADVAK